MKPDRLDWTNLQFLVAAHVLAIAAVVYMAAVHFSWWTVGLALVWATLSGLAITGGYHRHFSHRTYDAHFLLRLFYLLFGAAAVQNSALKWSADHRRHHARTDTDLDPYNIQRGFWWAHMGWIFYADEDRTLRGVADLESDPLVRFQHDHYLLIAVLMGAVLPAAIGLLWGDWLGALMVAGFLRLVLQWHAAFAVNSVAHTIGSRPFSLTVSARDSFITALVTLGEGYHNFHHRFQRDYRNGIRWFHLDPTKWFVWSMSKVGLTWNLRRTPDDLIRRARETVRASLSKREPDPA
jgi:stearoyl-CoA desaturase (delta-9 desaturase)